MKIDEAVKPVGHLNVYYDTPEWSDYCPNCGLEFQEEDEECPRCGQKLKWGKP